MLRQFKASHGPISPILPSYIRNKLTPLYDAHSRAPGSILGAYPLVYVLSEGRRFYGYLQRLPTGAIFHRPGLPYPQIKALNYTVLNWLN